MKNNDETNNKSLNMWKTSNTLDNVFVSDSHTYKSQEIKYYINHYQSISNPVAKDIIKLLRSTLEFRDATDLDDSKDRNEDSEIISMLNKIGEEFEKMKNSKYHSNEVFSAANNYCKTSIKERLENLAQKNDKINEVWDAHDNKLKTFLGMNNNFSHKKR